MEKKKVQVKRPSITPTKCTTFIHYITYIYCISSTYFGAKFTTIRENLCALYLKPDIDMKQLTVVIY